MISLKNELNLNNMGFIKKMDDYLNMIAESLNNPLEIKWVGNPDNLIGLFNVDNRIFKINCVEKGNNIWKFDFYFLKNNIFSPELTGHGKDRFRILPTVKDGMYYLHQIKNPNAIIYGAVDDSKGRKKIYENFSRDFAKEKKYMFYTKIEDNKQIYVLYKESMNTDILFDAIYKIVEEEREDKL